MLPPRYWTNLHSNPSESREVEKTEAEIGELLTKLLKWIVAPIVTLGLLLAILYSSIVDHVDNYELGYTFDRRTGEISVIPRTGYVITPPFLVTVHTVDLRPMQVCISSNSRVLNCKLVRFNKEGLEQFVEWHGRADYFQHTLDPILQAYAYEGTGRTYPFLTVITEIKAVEVVTTLPETSTPVEATPVVAPTIEEPTLETEPTPTGG